MLDARIYFQLRVTLDSVTASYSTGSAVLKSGSDESIETFKSTLGILTYGHDSSRKFHVAILVIEYITSFDNLRID
jgi:hypothetical protein